MTESKVITPVVSNAEDCLLPAAIQRRNILLFVLYWCIFYLCAPVTYISVTHANLLKALDNPDSICNLPAATYLWLTVIPVVVAWLFPQPTYLKRMILCSIMLMALMTVAVAYFLWIDSTARLRTILVIAHGATFGGCGGILLSSLWDSLRRGVSTSRRGTVLGFTFGCGPIFACLGSLFQDAIFDGRLTGGRTFGLTFPQNYCLLFASAAPMLMLAGLLMSLFVIPSDSHSESIEPTASTGISEGLKQFFGNRVVWYTILIYVLVYSGTNAIISNVSLHAKTVVSDQSGTLGLQNFLRFGCKAIAGALLGWLLSKTTVRAPLFATTTISLIGMIWALSTTGWPFMLTFGLLGMGELFGAYFPNYVTTASDKRYVRVNMSYLSFLSALIGFSSVGFGLISDRYGRLASFYVAAAMLMVSLFMICFLPTNPARQEEMN